MTTAGDPKFIIAVSCRKYIQSLFHENTKFFAHYTAIHFKVYFRILKYIKIRLLELRVFFLQAALVD